MTRGQELSLTHHPSSEIPPMSSELVDVHVDARAELLSQPFYSPERFQQRLDSYIKAPGFDLVAARIEGLLVGYAFGSPLPADTKWWDGFQGSENTDLTNETGARTFAFREILVRRAYQQHGIAHRLHDELLAPRPEERATLLVRSDNPAGGLYRRWGWQPVGYSQPFADGPLFESMVLDLAALRGRYQHDQQR